MKIYLRGVLAKRKKDGRIFQIAEVKQQETFVQYRVQHIVSGRYAWHNHDQFLRRFEPLRMGMIEPEPEPETVDA